METRRWEEEEANCARGESRGWGWVGESSKSCHRSLNMEVVLSGIYWSRSMGVWGHVRGMRMRWAILMLISRERLCYLCLCTRAIQQHTTNTRTSASGCYGNHLFLSIDWGKILFFLCCFHIHPALCCVRHQIYIKALTTAQLRAFLWAYIQFVIVKENKDWMGLHSSLFSVYTAESFPIIPYHLQI